MGFFTKITEGLKKTRESFLGGLQRIFNSFTKIDEELFEELEEQMIMSDIGVETSEAICDRVRKKVKERGITDPKDIMEIIYEVISEIMGEDTGLDMTDSPAVIMVIGVNGAGKTTTIGKMCHQFKQEGKKVLVAAADTFRAAAIDQLEVWTERAGVEIVKHTEGSDPGAVVYDSLEAAKARKCDVVIIDTAGRLHNKKNLMEELKKINRIIDNKAEGCSREVLLVLDATTGQNAVNQARLFSETAHITGIVLTKLDGTAKGGIVISIKNELGIPVKLIGVGEKIDDLQPFDSRMFVDALFDSDETRQNVPEKAEEKESADNEIEDIENSDTPEEETTENEVIPEQEIRFEKKKKGFFGMFSADDEPETAESVIQTEEETAVEDVTTDDVSDENEETESESEQEEIKPEKKKKGFFGMFSADDEPETTESVIETEEETAVDETVEDVTTDDVSDENEETESESGLEEKTEKKKKKGFFSRLFGKKGNEEDE